MSTPRYLSAPPSLSGSAISVSKAMTPSSPGLKSDIGPSSRPHGYQRLQTAACLCEFMDERTPASGQGSPGGSGAPASHDQPKLGGVVVALDQQRISTHGLRKETPM